MSLYRRTFTDKRTGAKRQADVWWFEFVVGGKRYRESTRTTSKPLAAACERRRRRELETIACAGVHPKDTDRVQRLCLASYKKGQADLLRVIRNLLTDVAADGVRLASDDLLGLCDYLEEKYPAD